MTDSTPFSVRDFLREREALLVHFSGPMTRHHDLVFPEDLNQAAQLEDVPLCFSTIQPNDRGPHHPEIVQRPEDANSAGCVGIIVDIGDKDSVLSVSHEDAGSSYDYKTRKWNTMGSIPSEDACVYSIEGRANMNEWGVKNFTGVGIFVFFPIYIRKAFEDGSEPKHRECWVRFDEVAKHFRDWPIFTAKDGKFLQYNRDTDCWPAVEYDDILNLIPASS